MSTIHDVARAANVSTMTVSRVINGSNYVKEETRQRVLDAMKDLNYVPNGLARSLVVRKTQTIALIVPDIMNPFFTTIARGTENVAHTLMYRVILCNTDEDLTKEREYLEMCVSFRVDGIVIAPSSDASKSNLRIIEKHDIPYVSVDRNVPGVHSDLVTGDSVEGAYQLVKHLIDLGHETIAVVTNLHTSTGRDRLEGYERALKNFGLPVQAELISSQTSYKNLSQKQTVDEWMHLQKRPTAVFAANNFEAVEIYKELQRRGIRVPEEMSIVCFDDVLSFPDDFFTTAKQPSYDFGVRATEILMTRINGQKKRSTQKITLPVELVLARSSGPPAN